MRPQKIHKANRAWDPRLNDEGTGLIQISRAERERELRELRKQQLDMQLVRDVIDS